MATAARPDPALPGDIRLMNATANLLAALGAFALAALAVLWLLERPAFAVRSIRIEGEVTRNSISTIRANAVPHLAGNFFTLDLERGRRAFESVPWVRRAEVRRIWPDRLAVRLEEHRPVAYWGNAGGDDRLVNSYGEVFEANLGDVEDDALPTLTGPDGSASHMLRLLARLTPTLAPLPAHVETLALSGRGSWRVELDTGGQIELGRGSDEEVVARAERFLATLPQVMQRYQRPLEYADLRHNDGYALRLKGVTTTLAAAAAKPGSK